MTETLTSTAAPRIFTNASPVPVTWGFWDCTRLATAAEMAAADCTCARCEQPLPTKKVGIGPATGKMIGRRAWPTDEFAWTGPYCRACNVALGKAEGYGAD